MPRYSFDVFSAGLVYADEVQHECCDRAEAEQYARELLIAAVARHQPDGRPETVFTAFIHEDGVGIVLSLIMRPGDGVQVIGLGWSGWQLA